MTTRRIISVFKFKQGNVEKAISIFTMYINLVIEKLLIQKAQGISETMQARQHQIMQVLILL